MPSTENATIDDVLSNSQPELIVGNLDKIFLYNYSTSSATLPLTSSYTNADFATVAAICSGDFIPSIGKNEIAYFDLSGKFKVISYFNNAFQLSVDISTPFNSSNEKIFSGEIDPDQVGEEIIVFDGYYSLNIYNIIGNNLVLNHTLSLDNFYCSDLSISDFDNDGQNEIVAHNANDGDFYIFKIVNGVLKESGREYFPTNFQNGLICAVNDPGQIYPNQLLSIRKFDGKITVYNMAGKCPNLDLNNFDITESISIDNTYTGVQNNYPIDYHSPNIITASNLIFESGVSGEFVSGTAIRMKDGFRATAGSEFTARIDEVNLGCNEPYFRNQTIADVNEESEVKTLIQNKIQVFPNPFTSTVNFVLPKELSDGKMEVSIFDNSGRMLLNEKQTLQSVNLSDYSTGIYILEVKSENAVFREKIIKQ